MPPRKKSTSKSPSKATVAKSALKSASHTKSEGKRATRKATISPEFVRDSDKSIESDASEDGDNFIVNDRDGHSSSEFE